jgi:predicted nucleic acid-binding protein
MIGLDTGFFIEVLKSNEQAVGVLRQIHDGEDACVSGLSLFELRRLSMAGLLEKDFIDVVIQNIPSFCTVCWLDNVEIHDFAAGLSRDLGISAMNSLILAGLILSGAETIYTTDSRMELYANRGVTVVRI